MYYFEGKIVNFEGGKGEEEEGETCFLLDLEIFLKILDLEKKNNALTLFTQGTNIFHLKEKIL